MSIERGKSPWGYGDEADKELGPQEVQRLRAEHKTQKSPVDTLSEMIEVVGKSLANDFQQELKEQGGIYENTYHVNSEGYITFTDAELDKVPSRDLLSLAIPTVPASAENKTNFFTPDDLREAARQLQIKYPELQFDFSEEAARTRFTAKVTLREKKE